MYSPQQRMYLCLASFPLAISLLLVGCMRQPDAEVLTEIPWALFSEPLIMDSHTHTRFSDGKYSVNEVVKLAINSGCDALAITDHSDLREDAATIDYFSAINDARAMHPNFVLFGGLEWNIPPYGGREHVTVLVDPTVEENILSNFKHQFEQQDATANQALDWLAGKLGVTDRAALIYNHPSRSDDNPDENFQDLLNWSRNNRLFIGFEGAPGHQRTKTTGSYKHLITTQDRWDPVAADIGGAWDRMLDKGHNIWAALAVSDYHNEKMDYSPCEFARTHIYPEDHSARGILAGLRAGSFWADHGHILDDLLFTLSVPSLPLPVTPGEVVLLHTIQPLLFTVQLQRGSGARDSRLIVELIGNGRSGKPELLLSKSLLPAENEAVLTLTDLVSGSDGNSAYLRVRIRKPVANGPDLMAYTNAIRVVTH